MTTRRSPSAGLQAIIRRMLTHPDATVKTWGRRVEAAYWHDQQIPLLPESDEPREVGDEVD